MSQLLQCANEKNFSLLPDCLRLQPLPCPLLPRPAKSIVPDAMPPNPPVPIAIRNVLRAVVAAMELSSRGTTG